jgi:hypothetical protein
MDNWVTRRWAINQFIDFFAPSDTLLQQLQSSKATVSAWGGDYEAPVTLPPPPRNPHLRLGWFLPLATVLGYMSPALIFLPLYYTATVVVVAVSAFCWDSLNLEDVVTDIVALGIQADFDIDFAAGDATRACV